MIVEMAKAKDLFITKNINSEIVEPTNKNNLFECLKSLFNFENVDVLGFDGISGIIENVDDLTNSLYLSSPIIYSKNHRVARILLIIPYLF